MNITVFLHDNQIYGLTKKQASPTSPSGPEEQHHAARRHLEPLNPLTVTLGVPDASFVAQAVDWIPEVLYDIITGGLSPPRLLVRAHHPALPGVPAQDVRALAARSAAHAAADARRRPAAQRRACPASTRTSASTIRRTSTARARSPRCDDPIPVGILYRNPDVPCYEDLRHAGQLRSPEYIRAGLRRASSTSSRSGRRTRRRRPRARRPRQRPHASRMDMQTQHQDQLVFHLTGKRAGRGLSAHRRPRPAPGAARAATATCTRLRHDFPLVLVERGGAERRALAVDASSNAVLQEVAPRGIEGERLRKHVLRLEREIRAPSLAGAGGTLAELWARRAGAAGRARGRDAGSRCWRHRRHGAAARRRGARLRRATAGAPAHATPGRRAQRARRAASTPTSSRLVRQAVGHPARGLQPLAGRAAAAEPEARRSAAPHQDAFDFDAHVAPGRQGRAAGRAAGRRGAGASSRRWRAASRSASSPTRAAGRRDAPAPYRLPLRQLRGRGAGLPRAPARGWPKLVKAISIAELEAAGALRRGRARPVLRRLRRHALTADDLARCSRLPGVHPAASATTRRRTPT